MIRFSLFSSWRTWLYFMAVGLAGLTDDLILLGTLGFLSSNNRLAILNDREFMSWALNKEHV